VPRGRHHPNSAHKGYADHATGYRSAEYRNYLPPRPYRLPVELRLDRYNHRSLTCGHESIRARSPCARGKGGRGSQSKVERPRRGWRRDISRGNCCHESEIPFRESSSEFRDRNFEEDLPLENFSIFQNMNLLL